MLKCLFLRNCPGIGTNSRLPPPQAKGARVGNLSSYPRTNTFPPLNPPPLAVGETSNVHLRQHTTWGVTFLLLMFIFLLPGVADAGEGKFFPLNRSKIAVNNSGSARFISLSNVKVSSASYQMPQNRRLGDYIKSSRGGAASGMSAQTTIKNPVDVADIDDDLLDNDNYPAGESNFADGSTAIAHAWPVAKVKGMRISSPFGWRDDPFTGKKAFHAGIDIAAPKGSKVLASADGVVDGTGSHPRLGKFVKIVHADGAYSLYGHLNSWLVDSGQRVSAGQEIGEIGSTGRSTGAHLDYSLRINSKPVNPLRFIKKNLPFIPDIS